MAELLTETGRVIGPDAAVEVAVEAMGADQVGPALRMLQPLALPPATGRGRRRPARCSRTFGPRSPPRTGAPRLELEELERIKPRTVLVVAAFDPRLLLAAAAAREPGGHRGRVHHAEPAWLIALLAASVVTFVFAAVSFRARSPSRCRSQPTCEPRWRRRSRVWWARRERAASRSSPASSSGPAWGPAKRAPRWL